jgi:hypothetical protein
MASVLLNSVSWQPLVSAVIFIVLIYHIANRYRFGLAHIPGPWLASVTDLWRLVTVTKGSSHEVDLELHRRYGPLVRLAPNLISVADPAEIPTIYGISSKFYKVIDTLLLLFRRLLS